MDTDKYNPMKKGIHNDFNTSSNSEPDNACANDKVNGEICRNAGVVNVDADAAGEGSYPSGITPPHFKDIGYNRRDQLPTPAERCMPEAEDWNNPAPGSPCAINRWQDSAPVMRLSAYLRANRDAGIRICRRGDAPCLVFDPPLRRSDIGSMRWAIASHAYDLAVDAKLDLAMMIRVGIITTEDIGSLDDIDAAGPSA